MSRYIDADKLCEHLQNKLKTDYEMGLYNHGALTESFIRFVERHPTADVVEVVRCKDCVYCRYVETAGIYRCDRRGYFSEEVKTTDYCSCGERREENEG
jgi:hypothetical protein